MIMVTKAKRERLPKQKPGLESQTPWPFGEGWKSSITWKLYPVKPEEPKEPEEPGKVELEPLK